MEIGKVRSVASFSKSGPDANELLKDSVMIQDVERPHEQESTECQPAVQKQELQSQKTKTVEPEENKGGNQQRLCKTHQVVLHKFPPIERTKAVKKLAEQGFSVRQMPAGEASTEQIIVVCYSGPYKNARHIVNTGWLDYANLTHKDSLNKYTFAFHGQSFFVFGKSSMRGMTEAEVNLWRRETESLISEQMGTIVTDLTEDAFIVLPTCSKGSEQLVTQVKALINTHRVTEEKFNSLRLLEERQIRKSLADGTQDYAEQHRVVKDVFKMFMQNDSSVFFSENAATDTQSATACLEAIRQNTNVEASCEEVLDAFKSSQGLKASPALNMMLLEDVILYVAEDELEPLVEEFCCLTGATKFDQVTPCLTTHIVCSKETPTLRSMIGSIHAKVTSGATSAKAALTTERNHLDLVTPEWLKACLLQQKQVKASLYRPEVIKATTSSVLASAGQSAKSQQMKSGLQYRVKQNIFMGQTFAILTDSFTSVGESQEYIEAVRRRIFESGGKVVGDNNRANYVVHEDGFFVEIWRSDTANMQDKLQRNIVHPRWIEECIRHQGVLNHQEYLNLIPLPHKAPSLSFAAIMQPEVQKQLGVAQNELQNGAIAFSLFMGEDDRYVFEGLAELYGIQNKFKDGVTKFVVCVAEENLAKSQKVRQSMRFRHKPAIVSLEWFIDSLEACQMMPLSGEGSKYVIDTSVLTAAQQNAGSRYMR